MNKPSINEQKLKKLIYTRISEEKRRGDIKKVADRCRKTPVWVSQVCSANREEWDDAIIGAMLDLLNSRKQHFTNRFTKKLKAA